MEELTLSNTYTVIGNCRVCGYKDILPVLFLGNQPLANSLKKSASEPENKYPLTLVFCPKCSLVQLKETLKKEILFDHYVWVSGTSVTTKEYANIFYQRIIRLAKIKPQDLILEIASNDGTFLKPFFKNGYRVIGIEPAKNIAEIARQDVIETLDRYWDLGVSKDIVLNYGKPKVIIARNVIPHVSELQDVIQGIAHCLADDGIGIIEFHYAGKILKELHYDSIYHEHLCYFSLASISYLLNKFNLFIFHIDLSPISGGSYCIYFTKRKKRASLKYTKLMEREKRSLLNRFSTWQYFSERCLQHRKRSREILDALDRKVVVGFGASARSSTYLNFCSFTSNEIKVIIDNNKLKQGLYTAGTSIPIVSIEEGLKTKPDLIFILAWNFKDEIIKNCQKNGYRRDYLIPFPQVPYFFKNKITGGLT